MPLTSLLVDDRKLLIDQRVLTAVMLVKRDKLDAAMAVPGLKQSSINAI
jgi:hypothetical protein